MNKVNLNNKLSHITEHWQPHIVAALNGQLVKLVKFKGPFTWHHHEHEDELFFVVKGRFCMEFRQNNPAVERQEWIEQGEMIVVPRGVEHRPIADEECEVMLFEPESTLNTGNVTNEFTVTNLKKI